MEVGLYILRKAVIGFFNIFVVGVLFPAERCLGVPRQCQLLSAPRQSRASVASLLCRLRRLLRGLGHDNARRSQQAVVKHVAVFQNLGHAAGGLFCFLGLHHLFVLLGIVWFVGSVAFLDAEAIHNLCQ